MIPIWLDVEIKEQTRRRFRIFLPLPVIYLILAPFALLLFLVALPICAQRGVNAFRVAGAIFALLGSLSGMHVEIQQAKSSFLMSVL